MAQTNRLMETRARKASISAHGVPLGYEAELWAMVDALRGATDIVEYKHLVLGLIFLRYVSDAFERRYREISKERGVGAAEDRDEYVAHHTYWIPQEARWELLQRSSRLPTIGQLLDESIVVVERDNPTLRNVLPRGYGKPMLDKKRLGRLIDLISNINVGAQDADSNGILGDVYEYFLAQFASAEGKTGGEFYTPRCVVKLLVEMIEPFHGRLYDPCCGSSGMFVQSIKFIDTHDTGGGNSSRARKYIRIYGQESNHATWQLATMNLAIRGIEGRIDLGDSFHNDRHPDLKADIILASPPFNDADWGNEGLMADHRWRYGGPPSANANFAWVQHMIHHLAPGGVAGFVLANESTFSSHSTESVIRKGLVEADLIDSIVALPGALFYSTQIPACLWFLARDRKRCGEVLFIDARECGRMLDRTHRELSDEEITRIAETYRKWRERPRMLPSPKSPVVCRSATTEEIRRSGYSLAPRYYVNPAEKNVDDELFDVKMKRLVAEFQVQRAKSGQLDDTINANLKALGFELKND